MSQFFEIHPENPQPRLIRQAVDIVRRGGVMVYPTDSCYALGCHLGDKAALERLRQIRKIKEDHHLTLICRNLSELATYAQVDNTSYRLLKAHTPGPYTFIFKATSETPRRLQNPKKKTIGIRIPDHPILLALLEELNEPLLSTSLLLPGEDFPSNDPHEIRQQLEHQVDLILDGGCCDVELTTVVRMDVTPPEIIRQGKGHSVAFEVP